MTKAKLSLATFLRHALRHPKREAFQANRSRLAEAIKQRVRVKYFPFNAPRPKRVDSPPEPILSPIPELPESIYSIEDDFVDFDGAHTPEGCIEVEDKSGRVMSWQRTPGSKLRETLPLSPNLDSIDFIIADYAQPDVNAEISNLIQHSWYENYELLHQIQGGAQGDIELCKHKPTGKVMVAKTVKTHNALPLEAVLLQAFLMPAQHRNIVQLHALFYDPELSVCNMVMEYCEGGDLHSFATHWLIHRRQNVPEMFLLHFISSVSEALGFLHLGRRFAWNEEAFEMPTMSIDDNHKPILHRDVKLDNIFLRSSSNHQYGLPDIVLGDFGGSCLKEQAHEAFGTPGYWAPEVERWMNWEVLQAQPGEVMTTACDIYSFGVTLVSLFLVLLEEFHPSVDWVSAFKRSDLRGWPVIQMLLQRCLDTDPSERLTTETLFNFSPIFKMYVRGAHVWGSRMPEDSWPAPNAPGAGSNDAMCEQPPDYSELESTEWSSWNDDDDDVTPVEFTDSVNPFRDTDVINPFDDAEPISAADTASLASVHTAIYGPVQKAVEVDVKPTKQTDVAQRVSKIWRMSGLFEVVENLANGLLTSVKTAATKQSLKSSRGKERSLSRRSRPVELPSRFSDDSDLKID